MIFELLRGSLERVIPICDIEYVKIVMLKYVLEHLTRARVNAVCHYYCYYATRGFLFKTCFLILLLL